MASSITQSGGYNYEFVDTNLPDEFQCPICRLVPRDQIIYGDHHQKECPGYPLPCPNNGCEKKIKRRLITQHRDTCPKEEVVCQYSKVGCHEKMKREDIPQHNKDKMEIHLRKAVCMIETLNCTIQQFKVPQQANGGTFLIKMRGFKTLKESNTSWSSPGVYTYPGYKFCLIVHPNGNNDGEGTHVSCYIRLIPGEYDDTLEWPFQGEVTVELLNQLEDKNHYETVVTFDQEYGKRKFEEDRPGLGYASFFSHSELQRKPTNDFDFLTDPIQYLKDDMLYFRVTIEIHLETKPWLVGAI